MICNSTKKLVAVCVTVVMLSVCGQFRCSAAAMQSNKPMTPADAVSAQYAQMNDAVVQHNLDKIMSFFTDDFTEVNSTGATVNREQERKEYETQLSKIKSLQIHYIVQNCTTTPTGTCCDVRFHMDGIGFRKIMFMKFEGAFTNDLMVHDVWIPTPDGLRIKSRLTVLDDTKIAAN